jgi:hypothetical protein
LQLNIEQTVLSSSTLLGFLHEAISEIKDPRTTSNATKYKLSDAILATFSIFFMQCQSFLEYQRQMQSRSSKDNAQTLFWVEHIPSDPQMLNILDLLAAKTLNIVFERIYHFLHQGHFYAFKLVD